MIEIKQTKKNNCFDACLASILEQPINMFPNYIKTGWEVKIQKWLKENFKKTILFADFSNYMIDCMPEVYHIISAELKTGGWHSRVAFKGKVIFDPSPKEYPKFGVWKTDYTGWKIEFILPIN